MYKKLLAFIDRKDLGWAALIAILTSGALTLLVKIFGLFKEITLAYYFGVSQEIDFYVLALLMVTFFVGPIAGSFSILLVQKFIAAKEKSLLLAAALYQETIKLNAIIFLILIAIIVFLIQFFSFDRLFFAENKFYKITYFFALVPLALFSSVSVLNGSVLSAQKKFSLNAVIPSIIPASIILCVVSNVAENYFISLLVGTILGYVLETIIGLLLNAKFLRSSQLPIQKNPETISPAVGEKFLQLFTANLILSGCLVIDQFMAFLAGSGAVSIINYSNRVPLGIISILGVIWMVLFPIFSELVVKAKHLQLKFFYIKFLIMAFFVLLLSSCIFFAFSVDIIELIFERGKFDSDDVAIVGKVQSVYFLYIPFYVVCLLSSRIVYSYEKHNLVLILNATTLILNFVFNLLFINFFGVIGIAYATLLSYFIVAIIWPMFSLNLLSSNIKNINKSYL